MLISSLKLRQEIKGIFGGMGSLTDVSLFVEGNEQATAEANTKLSRLLDQLYHVTCGDVR